MAVRMLPPAEYLRECLDYDPETGALTWRQRPLVHFRASHWMNLWNSRYASKAAGCAHTVYQVKYRRSSISIDKRRYLTHRVIWKIMTGREPSPTLDHRDRNGTNNTWRNLRRATESQQRANSSLRRDNSSGVKGVSWSRTRRKWIAQICINEFRFNLGGYLTKEEAQKVYEAAARKCFEDYWSSGL